MISCKKRLCYENCKSNNMKRAESFNLITSITKQKEIFYILLLNKGAVLLSVLSNILIT